MATIEPFRGILYNKKIVDISSVVTPPYDVISPSMQNCFYSMDPYNIVRLILSKAESGDSPKRNRHKRAKAFMDSWLKEKVLIKDDRPSIYVYAQSYLHKSKKRTRLGFISLMKIEQPKESGVLPHEHTLDKPKVDRLNLIRETRANLSSIFSLYYDGKNIISKALKSAINAKMPYFELERDGVVHKLWRLDDKRIIKIVVSQMKDKKVFIADGHHRYEAALLYRNKMRKTRAFKRSMGYVMMYFANLSGRGDLTILSTHRAIKGIRHFSEDSVRSQLEKYFHVKDVRSMKEVMRSLESGRAGGHRFGMYTGKGRFSILTLRKACHPDRIIGAVKTKALKRLDVTILHDIVINEILAVKKPENNIKYIRDEADAVKVVDKGSYQLTFFLKPTDVMDMKAVAEKGEMMPQKSTYFYPKLLTGLVINKF
ncbi:MAG: DUF1015 domain-containing protein [Candidatus Omnitrophota bacterium]